MHDAAMRAEIRELHREADDLMVAIAGLEDARTRAERGSTEYAELTRRIIAALGQFQRVVVARRFVHARARAAVERA